MKTSRRNLIKGAAAVTAVAAVGAQLAPELPTVWVANDNDWVVARNKEEVVQALMDTFGYDESEAIDSVDPDLVRPLTQDELSTYEYWGDDEDIVDKYGASRNNPVPFQHKLNCMIAEGDTKPQLFAMRDY